MGPDIGQGVAPHPRYPLSAGLVAGVLADSMPKVLVCPPLDAHRHQDALDGRAPDALLPSTAVVALGAVARTWSGVVVGSIVAARRTPECSDVPPAHVERILERARGFLHQKAVEAGCLTPN